jgi:hypothetical protein
MAHFAELDDNNIVKQVIVISNSILINKDGQEDEQLGITFCKNLLGENTRWVQTSYNNNFRVRFAGVGCYYDVEKDAFIPPQPFPSWILNQDTYRWEAPFPLPTDDKDYRWNESNLTWEEIIEQA